MQTSKKPFGCRSGFLLYSISLLAVGLFAFEAGAASPYTLTNGGTSVQIDLGSGVSNWQVDGVNQLNYQWFWYRIGSSGPESTIDTIATPTSVSYNPNTSRLIATYANSAISVKTSYQLSSRIAGSGPATMSELITLQNVSGSSQTFHFYQYSDFNLGGSTANQLVQFSDNGSGIYYQVVQTALPWTLTETATASGADSYEVQAGLNDGTMLGLADGSPTTFNNTLVSGPGDLVYGYEWDVTLASGYSLQISKILTVVPEPSVFAFLASGVLILVLLSLRRKTA